MIKVKTIRYKGSYIEMSKSNYDMPAIENEQIAIESVTKRDGTLAPFDSNRIYNAILKARNHHRGIQRTGELVVNRTGFESP
ncbi:MAG: ATP cone domain-containing protein [Alphaproteobacteria bacterium]